MSQATPAAVSPYASADYFAKILEKAIAAHASDVHLKVGIPPAARIHGELVFFRTEALTAADTEAAARLIVQTSRPDVEPATLRECDCAYTVDGIGRFRVNVYRQRGTIGVVMRVIATKIPSFEELGLPAPCVALCEKERGLVLVVGAAGQGKSSTLAAMIGHLNRTRALHIVTIEDPIEFLHRDDRSSVSQREIGTDTASFGDALRAALRQDPDVVLVGEIRDEVTFDIALKAAETGHLVLATVHTPDVVRTIGRLLALAPTEKASAVEELRERIAHALQGIVAQRLLPRKDGTGLVLATEILVATGTVRESIKRPVGHPPLKELMEKGTHPYGMQTFDMHIKQLVQQELIDDAVAREGATF